MAPHSVTRRSAGATSSQLAEILNKDPSIRSVEEVECVYDALKNIDFFKPLPTDIRLSCCKVFRFQKSYGGEVVFLEGEEGSLFYVILSGKVGIYVNDGNVQPDPDTPRPEDELPNEEKIRSQGGSEQRRSSLLQDTSTNKPAKQAEGEVPQKTKCIRILSDGGAFGEVALQNATIRSATVKAEEDCIFATLDRKEYKALLSAFYDKVHKDKVSCLSQIPLFKGWAPQTLDRLAQYFNFRELNHGEVLYKQGDSLTEIYVIHSGAFELQRSLPEETKSGLEVLRARDERNNQVVLSVRADPMQFLGFEEFVDRSPGRQYTVQCCSPTAKVLSITGGRLVTRLSKDLRTNLKDCAKVIKETHDNRLEIVSTLQATREPTLKYTPEGRLCVIEAARASGIYPRSNRDLELAARWRQPSSLHQVFGIRELTTMELKPRKISSFRNVGSMNWGIRSRQLLLRLALDLVEPSVSYGQLFASLQGVDTSWDAKSRAFKKRGRDRVEIEELCGEFDEESGDVTSDSLGRSEGVLDHSVPLHRLLSPGAQAFIQQMHEANASHWVPTIRHSKTQQNPPDFIEKARQQGRWASESTSFLDTDFPRRPPASLASSRRRSGTNYVGPSKQGQTIDELLIRAAMNKDPHQQYADENSSVADCRLHRGSVMGPFTDLSAYVEEVRDGGDDAMLRTDSGTSIFTNMETAEVLGVQSKKQNDKSDLISSSSDVGRNVKPKRGGSALHEHNRRACSNISSRSKAPIRNHSNGQIRAGSKTQRTMQHTLEEALITKTSVSNCIAKTQKSSTNTGSASFIQAKNHAEPIFTNTTRQCERRGTTDAVIPDILLTATGGPKLTANSWMTNLESRLGVLVGKTNIANNLDKHHINSSLSNNSAVSGAKNGGFGNSTKGKTHIKADKEIPTIRKLNSLKSDQSPKAPQQAGNVQYSRAKSGEQKSPFIR